LRVLAESVSWGMGMSIIRQVHNRLQQYCKPLWHRNADGMQRSPSSTSERYSKTVATLWPPFTWLAAEVRDKDTGSTQIGRPQCISR
jgi:hypothetical protein